MAGSRDWLPPYQTITSGDMTGSLTSLVTHLLFKDNVSIQLVWTGTPTGTFAVQGSVDYNQQAGTGTWTAITLNPAPAASGSADNALLDLNQLSFPYIRVVYTAVSSSGTLQCWISAKAL